MHSNYDVALVAAINKYFINASLFKAFAQHRIRVGVTLFCTASCLLLSMTALAVEQGLCEGLVTHTKKVLVPLVAKPPHMKPYKDPAFGTKVTRITNTSVGEVFKPAYSTVQAWNADESRLLLYRTGSGDKGHYLLDGHTYTVIKKLDIRPADLEEVFWSHSDPDSFFYVSRYAREVGHFFRYDVSTDARTLIRDFSDVCDGNVVIGGKGVQMQSLDDDLFGFRCKDTSQTKYKKKYRMFTFRVSTGEIKTTALGQETPWHNWTSPSIAPSGKRIWFQGTTLSPDLETVLHRHDMAKSREHANVGTTHNGQDALYQVVFDPAPNGCNGDSDKGIGHLTEYNLETGVCRSMVNQSKGYPYTTSATHVSAQAYRKPGWIALSSVGHLNQIQKMAAGKEVPVLLSEIYLVNTDPDNEVVCRLAHHRTTGKLAENGGYRPYFGEPHVTISPSGTRLLFSSDWYDSGSVDTYVIELPAHHQTTE